MNTSISPRPKNETASSRADTVDERDGAGQLLVVDAPRDHEDSLDVEDDEEDRDEVELDRESLAGVAQRRNAGFVGLSALPEWGGSG